jgi:pimeloyl-ACP methyl ester carboxylesterase
MVGPSKTPALHLRSHLVVAGVETSFIAAGPETHHTVVFVHGNPGSGDSWQGLIDSVATFARCIAPDMPGYGESDKSADFEYTIDGYARHLGALLETLDTASIHIVGHDLGGVWGLAWAASNPRQLASLTLMSIGALPGYRWHRYARMYRIPVLGELVLLGATRRAVAPVLGRGSQHAPPGWFVDEVVRQYQDPGTRNAVLAFYRATNDLGASTAAAGAALRDVNPATLVIWGAGDPYVPVRFAELQREFFPRAEILVLPTSGHWPMIEEPKVVTAAVAAFLRKQILGDGDSPLATA